MKQFLGAQLEIDKQRVKGIECACTALISDAKRKVAKKDI